MLKNLCLLHRQVFVMIFSKLIKINSNLPQGTKTIALYKLSDKMELKLLRGHHFENSCSLGLPFSSCNLSVLQLFSHWFEGQDLVFVSEYMKSLVVIV